MDYSSIFIALMGINAAFLGLICLGVWKIAGAMTAETSSQPTVVPAAAPAAPAVPAAPAAHLSQELIAAISAAIAEELGTDITGIRITSIKQI